MLNWKPRKAAQVFWKNLPVTYPEEPLVDGLELIIGTWTEQETNETSLETNTGAAISTILVALAIGNPAQPSCSSMYPCRSQKPSGILRELEEYAYPPTF